MGDNSEKKKKQKKQDPDLSKFKGDGWIIVVTNLMKILGPGNTVLLFIMWALAKWTTKEQKETIIDRYVLLEGPKECYFYASIVVILVVGFSVLIVVQYNRLMRVRNARITQLEEQNERLQNKISGGN